MADMMKLTACRLPDVLLTAAQRHADLYRTSVSELLREGLEYRLTCKAWPPDTQGTVATIPIHVHEVLTELARRLDQVRQELGAPTDAPLPLYNGYTTREDAVPHEDTQPYNGYTAESRTEESELPGGAPLAPADALDYDPTRFVLGQKLCRGGHDWRGTGRTLLRLPGRVCAECERQRRKEQRAAKRVSGP